MIAGIVLRSGFGFSILARGLRLPNARTTTRIPLLECCPMIRKTIAGLSLVAILATGASAQAPFQQSFTFVGASGSNGISGSNFDTYMGQFNNPLNAASFYAAGTQFQVWCVDPMQFVSSGDTYTAWVTPLNTTTTPDNFTHTLDEIVQAAATQGNFGFNANKTMAHPTAANAITAKANYLEAAYLASTMTTINDATVEEAMWQVMGYTGFTGYNSSAVTTLLGGIAPATLTAFAASQAADWGVISDGTYKQEFIYRCVDSHGNPTSCNPSGGFLSVTPEPATMSMLAMGLVGVAGSAVRRRRRRA